MVSVYDVTDYLRDHPGGIEPLVEIGGQDATSAYEDVGHSEDAREILNSFLIGHLDGYSVSEASDAKLKAQLPDVHIIRRDESAETQQTSLRLLSPRVELLLFAVGTSGLLYIINAWHMLPSIAQSVPNGHSGFVLGYSTAVLSAGVIGMAGARFLSHSSNQGPRDFSSYPARITSTATNGTFRPAGALNPSEYRKFRLRSKKELADSIWRFVFDLPAKHSILGLPVGQHVAVKGIIDEHTVVRSYTPISNNRDLGRLELLIKVYPEGKLGNYLKNCDEGAEVEIRGPKGAMKYRRDMSKRIGMIGGGTGITPLFQIIRTVCEDKKDDTRIDLLYGNASEADIMLRDKLDQYARDCPEKFSVYYVLGSPPANWQGGKGRIDKTLIEQRLPASGKDNKVLLCGPPGMVKAMTKSLVELGYEQPGAISRMGDQIFCF